MNQLNDLYIDHSTNWYHLSQQIGQNLCQNSYGQEIDKKLG